MTDQDARPIPRKHLLRLIGVISIGLAGLWLVIVVGMGVFYVNRVLPEETYESISQTPWKHHNVGLMDFNEQKNFASAEKNLTEKLKTAQIQEDPIPSYLLAELYNTLNRKPEAIRFYKNAIRLTKQSWYNRLAYRRFHDDAQGKLAILYYENNKMMPALAALKAIKNIENAADPELLEALQNRLENPDRADFHMSLGLALRHELKLDKAKAEIEQARTLSHDPQLKLDANHYLQTRMPLHLRELSPLARYYSLAGERQQYEGENLQRAAFFYRNALRENPNFEWAWNELAIIHRELKDYPKAEAYARHARTLNPGFYNCYLTLGDIALDQERYQEAIQHYQTAQAIINQHPETGTSQLLANIENQIGYAHESLQDFREALRHYQLAMDASDHGADEVTASIDYEYAQESILRVMATLKANEAQKTATRNEDQRKLSSL